MPIKARHHLLIASVILLVATLLTVLAWERSARWHPDEALYMSVARAAAVQGDWGLLGVPVDKPPLTFYVNALALASMGVDTNPAGVLDLDVRKGEFVGRVQASLASVLLVAVGIRLGNALLGSRVGALMTGWLIALSPLRTAFAPTAFTDLPMLLLATASLALAAERRWITCGLVFGLSLAAKPQSIFYLPLIVGIALIRADLRLRDLYRFGLVLLMVIALLWAWDQARVAQGATASWALGAVNYTPTHITPPLDYGTRWRAWWATVGYTFGRSWLTALLVAGTALLAVDRASRRRGPVYALLWGWVLAFGAAHLLLTLNLHDRNQIVLLPVLALLVAASLVTLARHNPRPRATLAGIALLMAVFVPNLSASLGSQAQRYTGIIAFADHLQQKPVATVIYDRWLTWQMSYYMGAWSDKRRVYYPTPTALAQGALALDERGTRYIIAPRWHALDRWLHALEAVGFTVTLDYESAHFVSYALVPP